jgi:Cu/Ag efflux pump CusA
VSLLRLLDHGTGRRGSCQVAIFDAAVEAARVRLRPIVMTTMAFIHMLPPYFASGAGAEMRHSVGTAMRWGAFDVTLFGLFLTPVFFYVIRRLLGQRTLAPVPAEGRDPAAQASTQAEGVSR